VAFSGDATIAKNLIARNTGVSFSTDSATTVKIGGDVELDTGSVTTGGNVVNPVQVGGSVSVDDSSVFGGNWSVGGNVTNAGKLNPGNSIGKIAVAGDLGLASTSEYDVQVNLAGQSDLVTVGGTATLAGAVSISPIDDYLIDHQYTILSAAGGFGGTTFDASKVVLENSQYLFIVPRLTYDANDVYLTIARNGKAFASIAQTANQDATANALDTLSSNNAAFAAVAKSTSAADAVNAFDQLSGESYASTKTALIQDSHYIRDAADERVRSSFSTAAAPSMPATTVDTNGKPVAASPNSSGVAVWTRGFGAWGHTDGEGGTSKLNDSTGGVLVGADSLIVNNWRVGGLFGYSHSNFDVDGRGSSAQSDNYHFGLYGGTQLGSVGIRIGAAYTTSSIDAGRSVNFANYADQTNSRYDVGTGQVFGEVGYQMNVGRVTVEPYANFAYVNLHSDAFQETGGDAALSSDGDTMNTAFSTLGLRGSADFGIGATDFTVRGSAGWQHAFGRVAPTTTVALSGSQSFSVSGVPLSRDVAVVDAGLNAAVGKNTSLGVAYLGQIGDGMQDHSFTANFNYKF
jgi:outer membrane autotransporter protein